MKILMIFFLLCNPYLYGRKTVTAEEYLQAQKYLHTGKIAYEDRALFKAKRNFVKAIQIDPYYADAFIELSQTYWELGEHHQALTLIEHILYLDKMNAKSYRILAKIFYDLKDKKSAMGAINASLMYDKYDLRTYKLKEKIEKMDAGLLDSILKSLF